ncbi:ABC transporter ATP-binding protein [Chelativorans alearense]|uniref:ABC transporter ATP-binding protein n=1 Tax=Chelativorans alearense TaxID=2681495 RepID=UPI0013D6D500|nr:ABC transporter ATP-binding protein [Chelativorans alearense]
MTEIVRIENLSKHFGDVVGVDQLSLSIRAGEFVTLLGPSGCGKSTLLRMIGGFEEPTQGRIRLDGQDVTHLPPNKRAVNMVFQDYALFPHMTVGRNVGYGLRVAGVPKAEIEARAREALTLVGLAEKYDARPHEMSGGQRQRVALARALVRQPKVLLLDEPLSALDANLREAMQVELRHLHQKVGLTFIMVTHDQNEALAMADRVLVMRDGRVVQDGTPEDLYDRPASPYVAGFVGTTNLFPSAVVDGRIDCFGQQLALPEGLAGRKNGLFGFRPEKARLLQPARKGGSNVISGSVEEVIYHGGAARIVVQLGQGSILVDLQNRKLNGRASLPGPGDILAVEIEPDAIMAFNAEAAE